jgi:hypothetical protein
MEDERLKLARENRERTLQTLMRPPSPLIGSVDPRHRDVSPV